jgi:predicted N-formylglutamate amidohydrolase
MMGFIVTNEHGSNRVPPAAAAYLGASERDGRFSLAGGFDIGAGEVARSFASELACPLVEAPFHPAVIDCNRPLGHRLLFSKPMRSAPAEIRETLMRDVHGRHQKRITGLLEEQIRLDGQVIHLAIHSFAPFEPGPVPEGETRFDAARRTDLGLLYDPKRELERALCEAWNWSLYETLPMLRVRRNYPIRGTRDGLTKRLRQVYPAAQYLGIELQLNQAWCARSLPISRQTILGIIAGLVTLCDHHRSFAA